MAYKPILFQKMKEGAPVKESVRDFNVWCMEFPFVLYGNVKELSKNDWAHLDGDDEYVPDVLPIEAYELTVKFGYRGAVETANLKIRKFLDYLTGRDPEGGSRLMVYDAWAGIGRRDVRVKEVKDDAELVRDEGGDIVVFEVVFKVNDPVTDIALSV